MRRLLKLFVHAVVVGLFLALTLVWSGPAQARTAPKTLADPRPVQAGVVEIGFAADYLGVIWDTAPGQGHADEGTGPAPHGEVRLRIDGTWTEWTALREDGAQAENQFTSNLVSAGRADAYHVRGLPPKAKNPRAVPINTTDGPAVVVDRAPAGAARALNSNKCQSRADWGADESLRHDAGNEVWKPDFYDAQVTTVHHTATTNNDPDPEATVRAIYRYHAVDNGWGDIGYQYLIDESGVVYEGRWSGTTSTSCETQGGNGRDFAHEADIEKDLDLDKDTIFGEMVTGAHTGGSNSGNLGAALLGEFTTHRKFGAEPKAAAVSSLEDLLAELAVRHGFDPLQLDYNYVNPVNGEVKVVPTIAGHRDYQATECPGERLYNMLPTIRQNVAAKMPASDDSAPSVTLTTPTDGATVSGTVPVTAKASDDAGVTQVAFAVDGQALSTDTDGTDGWTASWDTTTADGTHTITATATDTAGQTSTDSASVTVDNTDNSDGTATSMHVRDLDGTTQAQKNQWTATVVTTVFDNTGAPVAGTTVQGTWSTDGMTGSCETATDGTCALSSPSMPKTTTSTSFTVNSLTHPTALTYDATSNTDPDGDSDGTTITVTRSG